MTSRILTILCLYFTIALVGCGPQAQLSGTSLLDDSLQEYGLLNWNAEVDVKDGFQIDSITLSPDIGVVDLAGEMYVYPTRTTTYTLTVSTSNSEGLLYQYNKNVTIYIGPRVNYGLITDDALANCLSENNFTHLEQFDVIYCIDRGIVSLSGVEQFLQTQSVFMDSNQIADLAPLATLPNLNSVSLSDNNLVSLNPLSTSRSIRNIVAHNNDIEYIGLIATMTDLISLALDENLISDVSGLESLETLQVLSITHNDIEDVSPLANNTALLALDISHNPVNSGITELSTLSKANIIRTEGNNQVLCLDYAQLILALGPVVLFNSCKLF